MRPFQLVVLAALMVGVAAYVGLRVTRAIKNDEEFYATLLNRLTDVLSPKGFSLTGPLVFPRVSGAHVATFEGRGSVLDLIWDSREREVLLKSRRAGQEDISSGETLASAHVPNGASRERYSVAIDVIVHIAESLDGAA